jgi:hypothetical protein
MGRILRKLKQVRVRSLYRGDYAVESERGIENTDALAATGGRGDDQGVGGPGHATFPPNYLKPDDGRPRH